MAKPRLCVFRNKTMRVLLFCLLILPFVAQAQEEKPDQKPVCVLCFGDSITHGSALPEEQKSSVWPLLVEKQAEGTMRLINEGKGGRPTNSVAEFKSVLEKHKNFDVLLIALGTNDSRDISDKCVPQAVENINQMIEAAHAKRTGLRILLVGPPNINKEALGPTKPIANQREQKLKELNQAFKELAQETSSEFVSLFGVVPNESLKRDGVHPDAKGNEAIARVIFEALFPPRKSDAK